MRRPRRTPTRCSHTPPRRARRAAAAGAVAREATAQYARALRFGGALAPADRATLLEERSRACYLADDQVEAIEVIGEAVACRREAGEPLDEARDLAELSTYLSCRGRYSEAHAAVDTAVGSSAVPPTAPSSRRCST